MELLEALTLPLCPLCRVIRIADERQVWSYLYEHSMDPESRRRFDASLGFCRHHAGLATVVVQERELVSGATIALFYESVAEAYARAAGAAACPLCDKSSTFETGEVATLIRLLGDDGHLRSFVTSDGLCAGHLAPVLRAAPRPLRETLHTDHARRMVGLRQRLRELHRKKAHDVEEPATREEQESWREALWRFTGVHWDGPLVKRGGIR